MEIDRIKWNQKYKNIKDNFKPSLIIKRYFNLAKGRVALDIACGLGRNSIFLASKGFLVDAVDISDIALKKLKGYKNINTIEADLDSYEIKKDFYDLIICVNFLNRELFKQIKNGLKKDGLLIYETFIEDHKNSMNKKYLLKSNELLKSFLDLNIIYYEEKRVSDNKDLKAFLVAKKI